MVSGYAESSEDARILELLSTSKRLLVIIEKTGLVFWTRSLPFLNARYARRTSMEIYSAALRSLLGHKLANPAGSRNQKDFQRVLHISTTLTVS